MQRSLLLTSVLAAVLAVSACNDEPLAPENPADLGSYVWDPIQPAAEWERRAGLQVVELGNSLYLMGGRTPREPVGGTVIPGDSDLWSLSLIHISEPTRQYCQSRMPSSA